MQHLAMIMDGNRRWAKSQHLANLFMGHNKGVDAVKASVQFCLEKGIRYLSLYTLSLENFYNRSAVEKDHLFGILVKVLTNDSMEFEKYRIRIRFLGDRALFPEHLLAHINRVEAETQTYDKLTLNILFCYGAQQEMKQAVQLLARRVQSGLLSPDEITEDEISKSLWTEGIPDPDLIVRTGGAHRLSNFLLFQAAYSELIFLECFWPEVNAEVLEGCLEDFNLRQRNFGR